MEISFDTRLEDQSYAGSVKDSPFAQITLQVQDGQIDLDSSESRPGADGERPIEQFLWSARASNPAPLVIAGPPELSGQALTQEVRAAKLVLAAPDQDGEYYITLKVVAPDGREDTATTYFVVKNHQPSLVDLSCENAAWVDQAVVYGIVPRNFPSPGFQGIISKLDELQDLGVTALWLSPVNATPLGNYGYHVLNYFELEAAYGTKDDFRRMVQEAHRRGIRVLMDFVPNHTSEHHRYFEDTLRRGRESPYWDFYDRDANGAHTNYFYWSYLPNLNFNNPAVVQWITGAFAYWVREFDVDGFRVDVAWGIRQRNPEYWPHWRAALQRIKPDLLLLAEASARDSYYFSEGFDAAYDWTDELGHGAWEHVFEDRSLLCERLTAALTNQERGFHPDALIFRFLNNNDTGARFITRQGVGMTRAATALLLTLPGVPGLFLGDETGTEFLPYKTRGPLNTSADRYNLREYHKTLIRLRRQHPALHSRQMKLLEPAPRQKVFAYLRWGEDSSAPVLVLINFFDAPVEAAVTVPEEFAAAFANRRLRDLLTDQVVESRPGGEIALTMPPMTALLLSPEE